MTTAVKTRPPVLSLTEAAQARVRALLEQHGGKAVRVSVGTKGCSGKAYEVDFADAPQPGDDVIHMDGFDLYIDAGAVLYILGSEMDYVDDKFQSGFSFRNPNETGRCGCGESFTI